MLVNYRKQLLVSVLRQQAGTTGFQFLGFYLIVGITDSSGSIFHYSQTMETGAWYSFRLLRKPVPQESR
jgi:hypothetical protein